MTRTNLLQGSPDSQDVTSLSPALEEHTLVSMDQQFLDTDDGGAGADLFSFPVSAFEHEALSNMSPLDLLPFGQDAEFLDGDVDAQAKSYIPQAGPSSSPIQLISPLESLFPPSNLPRKHEWPESLTPEQVRAFNSCVTLKVKTC